MSLSSRSTTDDDRPITYKFSTRDLVTMALLSSLGGVLSTYVGYLGNMMNRVLGVPFGAGQFMAGLHVFWIVIAYGLVKKSGSASIVGLLKGFIEMITGSTHGIVIVIVSLIQGVIYDLFMLLPRKRDLRFITYLGAGMSTASNVFIFQMLYFSSTPLTYIILISSLSFASGIIFGGYFGQSTLDNIIQGRATTHSQTGGPVRRDVLVDDPISHSRADAKRSGQRSRPHGKGVRPISFEKMLAYLFIFCFVVGGIYYFTDVYQLNNDSHSLEVSGTGVDGTYIYSSGELSEHEVTILAELDGAFVHENEKNYTGIPLWRIIEASLEGGNTTATQVDVIGVDGYQATFSYSQVWGDDELIIVDEDEGLHLVGKNYAGEYWVREIAEVRLY